MNKLACDIEQTDFVTVWKRQVRRLGPFCLGIDPSDELLARWGLPVSADGLHRFCDLLGAWTEGRVALVKPQIAFFERFGSHGIAVLERFIATVRERGTLVLVDAKRGDIGSTVSAYATAYFSEHSNLRADGITANAYLGLTALSPLLESAHKAGAVVFVVVASSNPEGVDLQAARTLDGSSMIMHLAQGLRDWNEAKGSRAAGAVVGATRAQDVAPLLSALGDALVLMPGIGAQGATFESLRNLPGRHRLIPTASRSVLTAGPEKDAFLRALDRHTNAAAAALSS